MNGHEWGVTENGVLSMTFADRNNAERAVARRVDRALVWIDPSDGEVFPCN